MYAIGTVPTLYVLAAVDIVLAAACWPRSRNFAMPFLEGSFAFLKQDGCSTSPGK